MNSLRLVSLLPYWNKGVPIFDAKSMIAAEMTGFLEVANGNILG